MKDWVRFGFSVALVLSALGGGPAHAVSSCLRDKLERASIGHQAVRDTSRSVYSEIEFIELINRKFGDIFKGSIEDARWPYDLSAHGYRVRLHTIKESSRGDDVTFSFVVWDEEGKEVARFSRQWKEENGRPVIINRGMEVEPSARGKDVPFSRLLQDAQVDFLRKHAPATGLMKIDTEAVGGYAWATSGYSFETKAGRDRILREFKVFLRKNSIRLTDEELALFTEPCHFAAFTDGELHVVGLHDSLSLTEIQKQTRSLSGIPGQFPLTPDELYQGTTDRMAVPLGKQFMLGQEWSGVIDIPKFTPESEAYRYSQAYAKDKKTAIQALSPAYQRVIQRVSLD